MADEKKKKGLPALTPEKEQKYDKVINQIRTELGIPMNRQLLSRIALEEYMEAAKLQNGKYDIEGIAAPFKQVKLEKETKKLEAKLAKVKKEYDALK